MNYRFLLRMVVLALFSFGVFCACSKDDEKKHEWGVIIPSQIVANGDYLTTSVYGYSDYNFQVKYYWDGKLIQTTDKTTGLRYLVNEAKDGSNPETRKDGDHILKVEIDGASVSSYIQVYDKEKGYLGCILNPDNREIKNGGTLQGEMVLYRSTANKLEGWFGDISQIRVFIDNEATPVQTITNAPFKFSIPIKGLSIGTHNLNIEADDVYMWVADIDAGGVVYKGLKGTISYEFNVVQ